MSSLNRISFLKKTILCAAAMLLTTAPATADRAQPTRAEGVTRNDAFARAEGVFQLKRAVGFIPPGRSLPPATSPDIIRGQSPIMHSGGENCGCSACAKHESGWRGKARVFIDVFCLKHRWFRNMLPYNSCYKPVPPYLIDHNGYNTSCWRRLTDPARPCRPVLEGYPVEIQPLISPGSETQDDFLLPKESIETPPPAPADPKAPPLPDTAE